MEDLTAGSEPNDRTEEVLERAAEFYEHFLWKTDSGRGARLKLAGAGIEAEVLREFQIGYAPIGRKELLEHLAHWDYSEAELQAAGVATESERGHMHVHFRSRVMFPVREREGRILGFIGLATHLAPSWPLWLTSPERGHYDRGVAIFGIDRAAPAIAEAGRARVLNDCLEVLRLHQRGEREAVAVVQSPITREHLEQLAAELPVGVDEVGLLRERDRKKGSAGVLIVGPRRELGEDAMTLDEAHPTAAIEEGNGATRVTDRADSGTAARILQVIASFVIGVGIPFGWFFAVSPSGDDPGGPTTNFGASVLGVVGSYLLLALGAAFVSARVRARSSARRMRSPWEHGATEWQPRAWTYHQMEEVLIAAAVISIPIVVVMFVTIGGFG